MMVYIVSEVDYCHTPTLQVFSTRPLAEAYRDACVARTGACYDIEERRVLSTAVFP